MKIARKVVEVTIGVKVTTITTTIIVVIVIALMVEIFVDQKRALCFSIAELFNFIMI